MLIYFKTYYRKEASVWVIYYPAATAVRLIFPAV